MARELTHAVPRIPVVSNVTGEVIEEFAPEYWAVQARSAVRFADGVATLAGRGVTAFVELGPDATLAGLAGSAWPTPKASSWCRPCARGVRSGAPARRPRRRAHPRRGEVDWAGFLPGSGVVELPTYAFQRERFWLDAPRSGDAAGLA
ncbi:hypothetical protein [Streptomyces sp. KL116D]|uniref:hypothetical protein n=1 Tax=Streptomyces sp. KL116D TaxID=3045152 RepID=UPI003557C159